MDGFERTAKILKALAHPVRLHILQLLEAEGEACVCHLEASLDQRQSYISQQLAKLREASLVEDRRDGLNVFYGLSTGTITELIDDAKKLAAAIALAEGKEVEFEPVRKIEYEQCLCPSCEENLAVETATA